MSTTLVSTLIDGILLQVHSAQDPTDLDWQPALDIARRRSAFMKGTLVWTAGGVGSYRQRESLQQLLSGVQQTPTAVMNNSRVVLTILQGVASFGNGDTKSFRLDAYGDALDHLKVSPVVRVRVLQALDSSREQLGLGYYNRLFPMFAQPL